MNIQENSFFPEIPVNQHTLRAAEVLRILDNLHLDDFAPRVGLTMVLSLAWDLYSDPSDSLQGGLGREINDGKARQLVLELATGHALGGDVGMMGRLQEVYCREAQNGGLAPEESVREVAGEIAGICMQRDSRN
jgi:hypothetical protein